MEGGGERVFVCGLPCNVWKLGAGSSYVVLDLRALAAWLVASAGPCIRLLDERGPRTLNDGLRWIATARPYAYGRALAAYRHSLPPGAAMAKPKPAPPV